MAARDMWKMLHLLHVYGPSLTRSTIRKVGITCDPDTIDPLVDAHLVESIPPNVPPLNAKEYRLTSAARVMIQSCVVANRGAIWEDMRVDEPRIFVVMPFGEPWSSRVYTRMIKPAASTAKLECIRGDSIVRTGDLTANILKALFSVGAVVADVSVPNANVFYEIGLCHAIGKDTILLKQSKADLPADLAGAHYYEYDADRLESGRKALATALKNWRSKNHVTQVKALAK